jgi:selenide,water dikinase
VGAKIAQIDGVVALTDVTGFGLLGHLGEICEGSELSATIYYDRVPKLPEVERYLAMGCVPGGNRNNFKSYGHMLGEMTEQQRGILCDPQTSGGLLVIVRKSAVADFLALSVAEGLQLEPIGRTRLRGEKWIEVE